MKRKYIKPNTTLDWLATNIIMDTFSLPNTGSLDDPSFGQANGFSFEEDDDSDKNYPVYRVWDNL
ncbi:MAG: hypothetical protein J5637_05735 [Prevotella sp.]|nr:hypothetical protein [Prevotella sp.]